MKIVIKIVQIFFVEDNIILVEGRLSVREDEDTKIVARDIKEFAVQKKKIFIITITNLDENIEIN